MSNIENAYQYNCPSCGEEISTSLSKIGESIVCSACNTETVVPLPKVGLKKNNKLKASTSQQANQNKENETEKESQYNKDKIIDDKNSEISHGKVIHAENVVINSDKKNDEYAPGQPQDGLSNKNFKKDLNSSNLKKTSSNTINIIRPIFILLISISIGATSAIFYPDIKRKMRLQDAVEVESDEQVIHKLNYIVQRWLAARSSRISIEQDLKVTKAEMEANKMLEQIPNVLKAIETKETQINEDKDIALQLLGEINSYYLKKPEHFTELVSRLQEETKNNSQINKGEILTELHTVLTNNDHNSSDMILLFENLWDGYQNKLKKE